MSASTGSKDLGRVIFVRGVLGTHTIDVCNCVHVLVSHHVLCRKDNIVHRQHCVFSICLQENDQQKRDKHVVV